MSESIHPYNETTLLLKQHDGIDHNSYYEDTTITAILPLSESTVEGIHDILAPMFAEESSLTAVVLLIPIQVESLVDTVINGIKSSYVDIEVRTWSSQMNEQEAILDAVWHVGADYVLVLDKLALSGLDIEAQDRLLVHPFVSDLPDGPCGGMISDSNTTCFAPSIEPQRAAFVLPPFLAPVALLRNYSVYHHEAVSGGWPSFGEWTASIHDGVGGFVRGYDDAGQNGCIARCIANNVTVSDELLLSQASSDVTKQIQTYTRVQHFNVVIILPTLKDLETFSPTICRMTKNGADTHILLLSNWNGSDEDHNGAFPWLHDQLIQRGCRLPFSSLHSSSNEYANVEAAAYWLSLVVASDTFIIYGDGGDKFKLFETEAEKTRASGVTLIKLPVLDLLHADWIGSLDAHELRSTCD
jgi:hypothetical protein